MRLSDRVGKLPASGIRAMFDLADKYDHTINLCIGEPGFDTPKNIIDAGCKALNSGYTKYVANAGIMPLRTAIAKKMNKTGFDVSAENVIVTFGAGQSLMSAMQAILNPGDEILVPNPCFPNYFGYASLAAAVPVMVPTYEEDHFHVRADILKKYLTNKTKALIINSPGNPTGGVLPREILEEIADFTIKHDLIVISDEPYEEIIYDDHQHISIATLPEMFDRTLTVNSFSKTYAMTGWRIGYTVAPKETIKAMTKLQGSLSANVTSAVQVAAIEALEGPQDSVRQMQKEYDRSRKILIEGLNQIQGFSCLLPEGAFYAFANIKQTGLSSKEVAVKLLEDVQVVTTPGDAFGPDGEGYLRLSFAATLSDIQEAIKRMKKCFGEKG